MQSNPDIDGLIILYLTDKATPAQREALEDWLKKSEHNQWVFRQVEAAWRSRERTQPDQRLRDRRDAIWRAGTMSVLEHEPRRTVMSLVGRIAAAVIMLVAAALGVQQWLNFGEAAPPAMVDLANGAGVKSSHTLADGTEIWLNSDSRLRYPEVFSDTMRWVELIGEAFFDVKPDPNRPFVVRAGKTMTHVLGTSFNVEAYQQAAFVKVSLLEGKVQVLNDQALKISELEPGQQLLFSSQSDAFSVQRFDYAKTFGWKDGVLTFDGVDFESFRNTLERWYGVNIKVIGNPGGDWQIRARYENESLENVMRDVAFNKNFSYEIEDNNLIINFNVKAMIR